MPWTLTIPDLNAGREEEVRSVVAAIADLLAGRGYQVRTLTFWPTGLDVVRVRPAGECYECGTRAGLHALSCSHYPGPEKDPEASGGPEPLSESVLDGLLRLQPYEWCAWPADSYDQPVVEILQEHLGALVDEVQEARNGR